MDETYEPQSSGEPPEPSPWYRPDGWSAEGNGHGPQGGQPQPGSQPPAGAEAGSWAPPPPPPGGGGWRDPSTWAAGRPGGGDPYGGSGPYGNSPGGPGPGGQPGADPYGHGPYGSGWRPGAYPYGGGYGPYGAPSGPGWAPPGGPGGGWGGPGSGGGWNYGWPQAQRPRRSLPHAVTALLLVVAVLVGLGIGHGAWRSTHTSISGSGGANGGVNPFGGNGTGGSGTGGGGSGSGGVFGGGGSGTGTNGGAGGSISGAAAIVAPALVDIDTTLSLQQGEAAGTGIVLSSDGYVLTNNHVISGSTKITATDIGNGQTYTADVVGYDRTHDVAVIKLENASGLRVARLDTSKVSVGQSVVGVGNAGGVGGTPSTASGQVTALNQSITAQDESNSTSEQLTGLIQTDANIQPGDSGGALINSAGAVIGMDTAASTGFSFQTQGNQGFAIPIGTASSIASDIRSGQATSTIHLGKTAFLGVEVSTANQGGSSGATISGTVAGGPAAAAGLAAGDVITALGGANVTSADSLTSQIGKYHPGDSVSVTWVDQNGQSHTAKVTLSTGPAA